MPLRDGGFALGMVARANPKGVLLGYFFGERYGAPPTLADTANLAHGDAVLVGKFGHLGLKNGTWPIVGRFDDWDRAAWPMPTFVRYEELTGRSYRVVYDNDDPNQLIREQEVPPGLAEQHPKDGSVRFFV